MGKWDKFSNDGDSLDNTPKDESKLIEQPENRDRTLEKTEHEGGKATAESKDAVVKKMVALRDTVEGVIDASGSKMPAERVKDLEDARGTIDGAVGAISPENALANQQEASQSVGMGMGGSSGSREEDDN